MDPDPDSREMPDSDPDSMNPDPPLIFVYKVIFVLCRKTEPDFTPPPPATGITPQTEAALLGNPSNTLSQ